jgi:hypothetical protein
MRPRQPLVRLGATLVFEAIGDDKVRVNCQSWDDAKIILADQALQVVALGKILHVTRTDRPAEYVNIELTGLADAGYGPETK